MIRIEVLGEKVHLTTPYNQELVRQARSLGGRWDQPNRVWAFPKARVEQVRDLAIEIFGTDGSPGETVTLRVPIEECDIEDDNKNGPVTLSVCGVPVVRATGRDSTPRVSENCAVVEGEVWGTGSTKNFAIGFDENTVTMFEILEVPKAAAETWVTENEISFIVSKTNADRHKLQAERDALLVRLAEINRLLGEEE